MGKSHWCCCSAQTTIYIWVCLASYLHRHCGPMVGMSLLQSSKRVRVLYLNESGFQGTIFRVYVPTSLKEALRGVGLISSVTKESQTTSAFLPMGASRTGGVKWALGDGSLAFMAPARKGEKNSGSVLYVGVIQRDISIGKLPCFLLWGQAGCFLPNSRWFWNPEIRSRENHFADASQLRRSLMRRELSQH